jgi:hypothetical protein
MESFKSYAVLATVAALGLVACGKPNNTAQPQADARITAASEPSAPRSACDLLTAAEMSTALGGAVTQEASSRSDTCTYSSTQSSGPFAELKFTPGDGQAAMMASSFANRHEPGLADPLAGVGDQAVSIGPMVMIRRGEDLITLRVLGVDDTVKRIKLIYGAVNAKL